MRARCHERGNHCSVRTPISCVPACARRAAPRASHSASGACRVRLAVQQQGVRQPFVRHAASICLTSGCVPRQRAVAGLRAACGFSHSLVLVRGMSAARADRPTDVGQRLRCVDDAESRAAPAARGRDNPARTRSKKLARSSSNRSVCCPSIALPRHAPAPPRPVHRAATSGPDAKTAGTSCSRAAMSARTCPRAAP